MVLIKVHQVYSSSWDEIFTMVLLAFAILLMVCIEAAAKGCVLTALAIFL